MLALLLLALGATGCGLIPWAAHGVAGGKQKVNVEADHRGLEGQRVAVMVAADDRTLARSPKAPGMICRAITSDLVANVPGLTAANPRDVMTYQQQNPYWPTTLESRLLEAMEVDRLVRIDLAEYRANKPGNAHVFHGSVRANVSVHSADSDDPDNPTYYRTVTTQFPENTELGVVDAEQEQIELGMTKLFSRKVARLFYDHQVKR